MVRAKREAHNAGCGLLRLSAELRNEIYYICIPQSDQATDLQRQLASRSKNGLLQTCRLLRSEGLPFYYFNNSFSAQVYDRIWQWDWHPDAEACIKALPDAAFACFSKVRFRLELCRTFDPPSSLPIYRIDVELWHNRIPVVLNASKGLERNTMTYDFFDVKTQVQTMVNRLKQGPCRKSCQDVCKEDVLLVFHMLKKMIDADAKAGGGSWICVSSCSVVLG